ncbi:MAG: gamma-glutamyltransferase [Gemmatimonadota bacterium]|nr:gamma-glutamyltransferase [Gemmatimonadota bacterium]
MTRLFSSPAKSAAYVVAATFFVALVPAEAQNARQSASSHGGMVAAAQPLATEAGVRMLEMGGNAADAAVAAAFAIAVVEPTMNSIGGRNQILIRTPDGEIHGIDGTTQAPWDYDYDTAPQAAYGYAVIGVPGAVAGLIRLHSEYGSLPLETVMAPAIDYAENGFRVLPGDALRQAAGAAQAREFPGTRSYYLKEDGSPYRPGDLLVQRDYAATLRAIAAGGHDAFYRGEIAEKMAADLAANGSAVKLQAFHDYEAVDSRIVRGSYRGYDLVGLDVPAAGTVSIQALQIMEHFDPDAMDDEEWAAIAGQALGIASRELATLGTDSAAVRATSKAWARRMAAEVRAPAGAGVSVGTDLFPDGAPLPPLDPRGDGQGHTTHLSTADAHGMFVALTQTLGPNMGSKVATPGLGFLYASTLGGYLGRMEPGERARSFISPLMVLKDGEPVLVLGAAGGARIVSGVVQVISRIVDDGMSLAEALEAPRVHMNGDGTMDAETSPDIGWTPEQLADMRALGIEVDETAEPGSFSRLHAIQYDRATGTWWGAADPDWEGSARGPTRRPGS